jgi:hypothetical protein
LHGSSLFFSDSIFNGGTGFLQVLPNTSDGVAASQCQYDTGQQENADVFHEILLRVGLDKFPDIYKMPVNGGSGSHGRAHQVRASARTLSAFKITVAGGRTALTWLKSVSVHGQAHGAPGLTPLKSCSLEDVMQAFAFSLLFDQA